MQKNTWLLRFIGCFLVFILSAPNMVVASDQRVALRIDSLLPSSPLKECLDTSMQLLGDFSSMQESSATQAEEIVLIKDLLLGRIVRLAAAIDMLCQHETNQFLLQDIEYLAVLLKHIAMLYQTLTAGDDRDTIGTCVLHAAEQQLVQLLNNRLTISLFYSSAATPLFVPAIRMPDAPICLTQLNELTLASSGLLTIF